MTPEQYRRVSELYHATTELAPEARADFLAGACGGDETLRREVESLLAAHDQAGNYFAAPAMEVAAELLTQKDQASLIGQRLSRYQVLSLLGAGGMGEVFLAEDTQLSRKVALKLLPATFTAQPDRVRRLEREAKAASALNHPNILTIFEIGQVEGLHFMATEFVAGATLRQRMENARLSTVETLEIATQVASALSAAHEAGITHRDIKPENIMLRPDGLVKVLDFGIAKVTETTQSGDASTTETGVVMGTVKYMSPEQARGLKVDTRSDLFSLGVVLYEMIAGCPPFAGATTTDVIIAIVQQEPAPLAQRSPDVPLELEQIVAKALRKDREERYQTAGELLADLKGLKQQLELETISGRVKQASAQSPRPKMRRAWPWALTAGLILLLATGWQWLARRTPWTAARQETPVIAVLPFKNLNAEKESEYFADGLTDELIRNLSIIEGLEVRSRTSSFAFKDKPTNIREVGEKLKVNWVLDGSVLRADGKLRIIAHFARVDDDKPLWTNRFDRELKDIFTIQDEISREIVNQLRVNLGRGRRRYQTSVEAYDLYLRAGGESNMPDRPGLRNAKLVSLYEEVIAKDPSFAPAYAKLALLHAEQSVQFPLDNIDEAAAKLRVAAEKAVQLDPLLEEAHIAFGRMYAREGRWEQAENSFREALRLNPNRSDIYIQYADWLLEPVGRMADVLEQFRLAEKVDPLSTAVKANIATALISMSRCDEAAAYMKHLRDDSEISANSSIRWARLRLGQGRIAEAVQIIENRSELPNNPLLRGWLGNAFARSGRRAEAEQMTVVSQFANEQALIFAGLGDKDRTFAALESMGSRGPQRVGRFLTYPEFGFLRGDPRLAALRKKVGLPQ